MDTDVPVKTETVLTSGQPVVENGFLKRRALQICAEAELLHAQGKTAHAIPIYAKSLRVQPTAEAHCLLGWAYSAHKRYDLAIRECLKSIAIDSDFGNPYNDIGSYLVSQGKHEEAIVWFERAKRARNCDSKHFPYMNLGRLYASRGWLLRAFREFEKALTLRPGEKSCLEALAQIKRHLA